MQAVHIALSFQSDLMVRPYNENTTHRGLWPWKNEAGTDLGTNSPMACFHRQEGAIHIAGEDVINSLIWL